MKSKGSHYERELVKLAQDAGLFSERVPLSGALPNHPHDVIVGEYRVECKYRRKGQGFSAMHKWLGSSEVLYLPESNLRVVRVGRWLQEVRRRIDGDPPMQFAVEQLAVKRVTERTTLLGWMGTADALALRRAGTRANPFPWLICERGGECSNG